ncbi:alpha-hydroxy acid oxidase [Amnibacterium sp.]|uniref:alpha-hydroxy acid oxidase n=1 Tax=Microbacteriaceae TaxID=85023 RepID=UPI003F7B40BB
MEASTTDEATQDYFEGGSGEEITLAENEAAWRRLRFRPRVLTDVGSVSTTTTLLGAELATPILVGPTALHGLAHPEGEPATARGTAAAGSLFVLSTRSSVPLEQVAAATRAPWWFQLYVMRDRALTGQLAERAAAAGARALVLTGDTPRVGEKRRSTASIGVLERHRRAMQAQSGRALSTRDVEQDPAVDAGMIGRLRSDTGLPVLVKGVLRADDAQRVLDAGAAGIIVSNHGGRQLDRAVSTAVALPEVVDAVPSWVPVLVDGGIRTGLDVLAALALGARGVLLGRPAVRSLADGGADGVRTLLDEVRRELEHAMALAGAASLEGISRDLLVG